MTRLCPYCGRNIQYDARFCPYCEKTLAIHEGMIHESYDVQQKNDKTLWIVLVIVLVVIIVPIAIAATLYVYFSGILPPSSINVTPDIDIKATGYASSANNATIVINSVSGENTYWSYLYFSIYDETDNKKLNQYTDYTIPASSYSLIKVGDQIQITGKDDKLEPGHIYHLSIIYYLTDEIVKIVTWTQ